MELGGWQDASAAEELILAIGDFPFCDSHWEPSHKNPARPVPGVETPSLARAARRRDIMLLELPGAT